MDNDLKDKIAHLKELAQKAGSNEWAFGELTHDKEDAFCVYSPEKDHEDRGDIIFSISHERVFMGTEDCVRYIAAANPQAILELIDKIERTETENEYLSTCLDADIEESNKQIAFEQSLGKAMGIDEDYPQKFLRREILLNVQRLMVKIKQLDKETDWLAEELARTCRGVNDCDYCECQEKCTTMDAKDWREMARKAVEQENEKV